MILVEPMTMAITKDVTLLTESIWILELIVNAYLDSVRLIGIVIALVAFSMLLLMLMLMLIMLIATKKIKQRWEPLSRKRKKDRNSRACRFRCICRLQSVGNVG